MSTDSTRKTILVALAVCLVCSVLVSTAAVGLKGIQNKNKELDKLKNILSAGNIGTDDADIRRVFAEKIEADIVELSTGKIISKDQYNALLNPDVFDIKRIAKDPQYSRKISPSADIAQIKQMPKYMAIYRVIEKGEIQKVILPIYGKGLWSTMYGFIALDKDLTTVKGFTFYDHGETPGLGGEVDNPRWKQSWIDKKLFDENGQLKIEVIKDKVDREKPDAQYQVDGLSGATITTRGVDALVRFWLSESGYGPYIERMRTGEQG
ncbi:MAG TPA: Na(+)-translocating NADH-quinone reductase subunit C [Candidatus Marinimicrobia bacterium]|nr:Na(+)-translocating NADH-quinone reductase subunit C [Candidatus Neomarinimicrobiota bacterium]